VSVRLGILAMCVYVIFNWKTLVLDVFLNNESDVFHELQQQDIEVPHDNFF